MHSLSSISIKNFRSCNSVTFNFSDFSPIVGYNNGGKSNILAAIKWLLRASVLIQKDFCDPNAPIIITGKINGITDEILGGLIPQHRSRLEPYCSQGLLTIRRRQEAPGGTMKNIILEIRNPYVENENDENAWAVNPTGIDAAIKAIFPEPIEIGAMENATEDVSKSKSGTTIGKLIAEIMSPIEEQHGISINKALNDIKVKLGADGEDRIQELTDFDITANEKLNEIFPGIKIRLHVPPPEIKEIFKNGTIKIFEGDAECGRDIESIGHGAQRSIQMALIRHLAEIKSDNTGNPTRTLLLVDEPELYLHPQAIEQVRLALRALSKGSYQVIFATHSPLMIGKEDIGNTLIIRKNENQCTFTQKRLSDAINEVILDTPSQTQTLFELSNSSQILFSDKVVIIEGPTEKRLIPEIYQLSYGTTLSASKIALVSPGGSGNTAKCLKILYAMGIPAKALVDLDFIFKEAVKSGFFETDDEDIAACRDLFSSLAPLHNIALGNDGFPCKNGGMVPAEAFALIASQEKAKPHIDNLHQRLLEHNIWAWKRGAIEKYLGIDGKNEKSWINYAMRLSLNGCEATLADYEGTLEFLDWMKAI